MLSMCLLHTCKPITSTDDMIYVITTQKNNCLEKKSRHVASDVAKTDNFVTHIAGFTNVVAGLDINVGIQHSKNS